MENENMSLRLRETLKTKRLEAKMSQSDLGVKLGYSSGQFVSNWEREVSYPPMDKLAMMTKLFKLNKTDTFNLYIQEITEQKNLEFKKAINNS